MSTIVKLKKSSVAGRIPDSSDLEYGELALNYADGFLYYKSNTNTVLKFKDSAAIDSDVDDQIRREVDSAFVENLIPTFVTLTGTQTLSNKTLTSPSISGTSLYGDVDGKLAVNVNLDIGDSTLSALAMSGIDSNADTMLALSVPNQVTHTIGTVVDRANDTSKFVFGAGDASTEFHFTRNVTTSLPVVDWDGGAVADTLMKIGNGGIVNIYNNTNAITKTTGALIIAGGLGVDKDIRAEDIYAANNIRALGGKLIGDVDGTVDDISNHTTTNLAEGTNLYYTTTRFDSDFNDNSTTNLSEGTNKYYTSARADSDAKNAISVVDNGGFGSLAMNAANGVITYNGPSTADVRGTLSAGTGITYNSATGQISLPQSLGTGDSVEHGGMTISGNVAVGGNLSVVGNQTITSYVDLRVSEPLIKVADSNNSDAFDLGLVGRYSKDGGTTLRRAGFVRDATTGEWHVFANLIQNGLDSSSPDKTINLNDSTVEYPIWNFGGLRGQYLGFDSDFRVHSTNYTVYESDFTAVAAGRYGINADNNNVNITLPASPTVGDWIRLIDVGNWSNASYSPKLLRNGSTIEGTTTDFELDVGQNIVEVLFINNTWNIYAAVGQRGPQGNQGDSGTLDSSNFSSIATSVALSIALG